MRLALFLLAASAFGQSIDIGVAGDGCSGSIYSDAAILPDSTMRFGTSFGCDLPSMPGVYRVTLQFYEPDPAKLAGQRVFRVIANGVDSGSIDLVKAGCVAKQPCPPLILLVTAGPNIRLQITSTAGNAVLSGVTLQAIPLLVLHWSSCAGGTPPAPGVLGSDCTGFEAFTFVQADGSTLGPFVAMLSPALILDPKWTAH